MADDPLAEFRSKKPESKKAAGATGRLEPYAAFKSQDRVSAIDIRRAGRTSHSPSPTYLLNITYGRRFYTRIRIFYTYMVVKITGENLKEVVDALTLRKCSLLQEFHPAEFAPPPAGAPIIHKIEILVKHFSESMMEAEEEDAP